MADNLTSSSNASVCTVFETHPYVIVAAVSSGSAMVSALCCIFVIGLIFFLKKQVFFIQRIILYHCLATLLRSLSTMLRLNRLGYRVQSTSLDGLCVFSGFMNQITLWMLAVDYTVITFTLLMTAVFRKNVARLEGLYVVLIFVLPFTFNWIPFIQNTYGLSDTWCWLRKVNFDDCSAHSFGVALEIVLWTLPFAILCVIMLTTYLITIVYVAKQRCRRREKKRNVVDRDKETLKKNLHNEVWWPIVFFPFGVLFLNFFPLIRFCYEYANPGNSSHTIWVLNAIFSPLQGGFIALIYILDIRTLKRITYNNVKATISNMRRGTVVDYPVGHSEISDSAGTLDRLRTPYQDTDPCSAKMYE